MGRVRRGVPGGGRGRGGSIEWRRGASERSRWRAVRVDIGVVDIGGSGRSRSCTAVRRECWCRR